MSYGERTRNAATTSLEGMFKARSLDQEIWVKTKGSGYHGHCGLDGVWGGSKPRDACGITDTEALGHRVAAAMKPQERERFLLRNGVSRSSQNIYDEVGKSLYSGNSRRAQELLTLASRPTTDFEFGIAPSDKITGAIGSVLGANRKLANRLLQEDGVRGFVKPVSGVEHGCKSLDCYVAAGFVPEEAPPGSTDSASRAGLSEKDALLGLLAGVGGLTARNFFRKFFFSTPKNVAEGMHPGDTKSVPRSGDIGKVERAAAKAGVRMKKANNVLMLMRRKAPLFFIPASLALGVSWLAREDPQVRERIRGVGEKLKVVTRPVVGIWKSPWLGEDADEDVYIRTGYEPSKDSERVLDYFKTGGVLKSGDVLGYDDQRRRNIDDLYVRLR